MKKRQERHLRLWCHDERCTKTTLVPIPFPWDQLKLIQAPYPMEHQSCVSVGKDFEEDLILHETAHEWWGNSISCRYLAHIWIH